MFKCEKCPHDHHSGRRCLKLIWLGLSNYRICGCYE